MKKFIIPLVLLIAIGSIFAFLSVFNHPSSNKSPAQKVNTEPFSSNPLSIEYQRKKPYPGSDFITEQKLTQGTNYNQYIVSYISDGLKIYGLLAIPTEIPPPGGFPAIIFNHGYIPPEEYRTTERYVAYFTDMANAGYVVFKPDYRGNGNSEGKPEGAYFSPGYTTDVLNALSSVQRMHQVNSSKIGMWGHSLGGFLTLRALVITKDVKVAVIWGGVVGSYKDMSDFWWSKRTSPPFTPSAREQQANRPSRQSFAKLYGTPSDSAFWNSISATTYLNDINAPIQLHHGLADETVPPILSQLLYDKLKKLGKNVEIYTYEGNNHNISQSYSLAMDRTLKFFNKYLK